MDIKTKMKELAEKAQSEQNPTFMDAPTQKEAVALWEEDLAQENPPVAN